MCIVVPVSWLCAKQMFSNTGGWWRSWEGVGGLTQERRLVEEQRRVEGELVPRWKSRDPAAAGLVLDPVLGNSLRILELIVIIEKTSLIIKMTQKCVLYLGKTKLKSDNLNEKLRTCFLPRG